MNSPFVELPLSGALSQGRDKQLIHMSVVPAHRSTGEVEAEGWAFKVIFEFEVSLRCVRSSLKRKRRAIRR